jgi:ATP-binding cassette, subfamily B, bacterial MsbA
MPYTTTITLMTTPTVNFPPATARATLKRLITYYGDKVWLLAVSLGLVMASSATEVALLSQIQTFIDTVFVSKDAALIWIVPALLIGAFTLRGALTFAASYINQWLLHTATATLRRDLFAKLLHLPDATFKQERSSSVLAKFTTDANNALVSLTDLIVTVVREGALVMGIMGYLLWLNWQLTLVVMFTLPVAGFVARLFSSHLRSIAEQTQDGNALMIGAVKEAVAAQRMVKVHEAYGFEASRFASLVARLRSLGMRSTVAGAATAPVTQVIASVGVGIVMSMAIYQSQYPLNISESMRFVTAGVFTALLSNMVHLFQPLKQLASINAAYARTVAAANSVFEFLNQTDERSDRGTHPMPLAPLMLEIDAVSLQYGGSDALALDGVSFILEAGKTTTLLGRSGSGKSSFAALLPRLMDVSSGQIRINGIPIQDIRLLDLRQNIAMVTQEAVLVDDTVLANIAYGDANPSEAKAWEALESAGLAGTVRDLPDGLNAMVGESGSRLSGGQRQRLTIARAFYKNAPLLILDEATSALDVDSEAHVQAALKRLQAGRTCLVITHRLSTVDENSQVLVLEAGRVIEVRNRYVKI